MLEERASAMGLGSVDQLVGYALDAFESNVFSPEELDDETWAAIEAADVSGEGVPWEQVKLDLQGKRRGHSLANGGLNE